MTTSRVLAISSSLITAALLAFAALLAAGALTANPGGNGPAQPVPAAHPYVQHLPLFRIDNAEPPAKAPAVTTSRCARPAPATAAGYQALWATVPTSQWGGADVSISVPLPDGRIVWLYGDTLSTGHGMVHQSAIVQDRGCLHVSNGGAQLEPNIDAHTIEWIEAANYLPDLGEVFIQFRVINLTGHCAWCFKDAGWSYLWGFTVDKAGDLHEGSPLGGRLDQPMLPSSPLVKVGPHHFTYAVHTHPEIRLASGRTLVTTCQNWDDGLHSLAAYRPIFTER